MKRKRVSLLIFAAAILISLSACGKKPDYSLPEQNISTGYVTDNLDNNGDDNKEEFDSKNAYEYARLESILQELKRQTDDSE